MSAKPISRFSVPDLVDLPEDIRERIVKVQEKSGFVPNVFLALAHRPDEFRAFFAYHDALMEKPGGLTKAEREMIVVATSAANQCHYCVVAHGAILRIRAKNPLLADQVAINHRKADITAKQRAMLDFALKVATRSHEVDDADIAALKEHGFSREDVWDIAVDRRLLRHVEPAGELRQHPAERRVLRDGAGVRRRRPALRATGGFIGAASLPRARAVLSSAKEFQRLGRRFRSPPRAPAARRAPAAGRFGR